MPHDVVGDEAAEYYTPERLAATGPFPLGQRRDLMFFNGGLHVHSVESFCRGLGATLHGVGGPSHIGPPYQAQQSFCIST